MGNRVDSVSYMSIAKGLLLSCNIGKKWINMCSHKYIWTNIDNNISKVSESNVADLEGQ